MIVKILSRNNPSYASLIDYILKGSKANGHESQIFTQNLQEYHKERYPQITQSFPEHYSGQEYITDREWQARHKGERAIVKVQIQQTVHECFAKAKTQKEFLELLRDRNLPHYERNGVPT